jgi:hypothetical protein
MPIRLAFVLIASWILAGGTVLDFEFFSTGGYGPKQRSATTDGPIVLLETPALDNPDFRKQSESLKKVDGERLQARYVVACPLEPYRDGYHTTTAQASLLRGSLKGFRITLLAPFGKLISRTVGVLGPDEVTRALEQKASK